MSDDQSVTDLIECSAADIASINLKFNGLHSSIVNLTLLVIFCVFIVIDSY